MPKFVSLSVLMFLQFFIWGAWFVSTGNLLDKHGDDWVSARGAIYSVCPIAAMISPLFLGLIADRFFATQKILAFLHLASGGIMFYVATLAGTEGADPSTYIWTMRGYALLFMPTIALTNTIAFTHVTNQEKQFPLIRVFGTLGWIAAGMFVSWYFNVEAERTSLTEAAFQYKVSAVASLVLGVFCFFLPHTPPPLAGKTVSAAESLGLGSLYLLKRPSYLIFIISSFLICIPLMAYYALASSFVGQSGIEDAVFKMTYGQVVEVVFMLIMPLLFLRLGVKWMLAAGMAAWVIRYGLFSAASENGVEWMILSGILLHGICYDFFFVTGYIYVDKIAPPAIRGQAQGFLILVTLGVGSWVGAEAMGQIEQAYTTVVDGKAVTDWASIWQIPMWASLAVLVFFVLAFHHRKTDEPETEDEA